MRFRLAYKLAIVLTKSQLRGYQRRRLTARIFGDPRSILLADLALMSLLSTLSYFMISRVFPPEIQSALQQVEAEALAGIPTAMAFAVILFGILSEISQPIQSTSTDLVNWLPVSPAEYVAGSALSLSYTYSFLLTMLLGISLGPAIYFKTSAEWESAAVMAIVALIIGACAVEVMRALTNRISSSFYRKSGRSAIFVRLFLTIVVLVFFQLLFSGQIMVYLLRDILQAIKAAWFVPVVWPSLVVLSVAQGAILSAALFGFFSLAFLLALFALAVVLRALYWVPIPVSIRLTSQAYRPLQRSKRWVGLGPAELAILRKDWRSLTRRREMARFLAIPFVLAISMGISFLPMGGGSTPEMPGFLALVPLYIIPVAIFCGILSMTSMGQEGYAVWNLYVAPLSSQQLLKAKLLLALVLSLAFSFGMLIVLSLLLKTAAENFLLLLALGSTVVLEESALGSYFGAKFADFRETIRSRFVSFWGSFAGVFLSLFGAVLTVAPIILSILTMGIITGGLVIASFAIGAIIFLVGWKLAERQLRFLLRNIQV
jgi:hypothetical protein